jgi:prevent-host-death family protein
MATYAIPEEDDNFRSLIDRAEAGETIVITRQGRPVARLEPLSPIGDADRLRALAALKRMDEHALEMNLGPFNWEEWKTYRDEGRR